nr:hypothetical protein [Tanacetum cinerariifolium]
MRELRNHEKLTGTGKPMQATPTIRPLPLTIRPLTIGKECHVETVFRFYQRYELTKGREATSGYTKSGNGPPALQGVRIEPLPGRTGNNISTFGRDRVVYVSTSPYIVEDGIETYNP